MSFESCKAASVDESIVQQHRAATLPFERELKSHCRTPVGPYLRPFSANRDWKTASVFIIGDNPATPLRDEFDGFDAYWTALTEDIEAFRERYAAKHSGRTSKTTARVQHLASFIGKEHCLVTNSCWVPATSPRQITRAERRRDEGQLKALIKFCRPKVILLHGSKAVRFAGTAYGLRLDPFEAPAQQDYVVKGMRLFAYPHFSGLGVPGGKTFQPDVDFPVFAMRIRECLATAL
ncbi:hypothetical protein GCT13_14970 [Paraburkholderia sp. CNPSo 3157]|uniref:Uracil-DNA glycosylase-like domain-containing protein n=1 Tax=Paraburkholderia franconis TaxID=2654983 RepID=A0A7X1TGG6_9BURK|nr:uracil-DNA glycosylase family protein [Paraburkholderia franconis]MPW18179.1 hypothetical protein [Paraburkholderia franconis]